MVTQRDAGGALLHVNIGGLRRSLCCASLRRFPDTRLGKLLSCDSEEAILQVCDDYDVQQEEFYFDRSPGLFPYVLHFYRTGKLHVMEELQEMEYWGINEFFLDSCCSLRYHDRKTENRRRRSWDDESDASSEEEEEEQISELNRELRLLRLAPCGASRKLLWLLMENPGYSASGRVFSLLSIGVVLTSIAMVCLRSIPEYQVFDDEGKVVDDPTMEALEVLCTGWFTFEVLARLLLAPNKRKFFRQPLSLIDVVSVAPVYATLLCDVALGPEAERGPLGRLLQHSYREVGILLLYLAVGVSVFSGIAYTAEYEEVSTPHSTHSTHSTTHSTPHSTHSTHSTTHSTPHSTHSTPHSTHSTHSTTHSTPHSTPHSTHSTHSTTHSTPHSTHSTTHSTHQARAQ
ncbi:Potassium voltage-gated channel subfamily S member 2 [Liparis tanakae]|uniref:Delayed-rectifier potassium channel regulatory subunit KCNS1 n=1 Tax=Liparis tanakae TaxID=230148 RepID=A0A4Z2FP75_9TELE|nr:Potassium voltage-gated channel subfamily S member 2 [Liparis tanakae]